MPFIYPRTIRFQDTDAAGVVYFANLLVMCHEAYEESLTATGIELRKFFSNSEIAIPIVHASVNFFRPMFCGDRQAIQLTPQLLAKQEFEITYEIFAADNSERLFGKANTRHVCIDPINRTRQPLPSEIIDWLNHWRGTAVEP